MEKLSSVASDLWPYLLPRIEKLVQMGAGGSGGGSVVSGAPTPHAISSTHHSGTLADSQGPQFLKIDGSRSLVGNLSVSSGVTIDGVDLSAHAANPSAHHAPVTAGDGIDLSGQQVSVDVTDIIDTAYGLTESSNNIRVNLASPSALAFSSGGLALASGVAGSGLTLAAQVLAVGAGAGITVNADDVALTTPGGLSVSTTNSASGNHTHAVTASADVGTTPAAALLKSTAAGGLTLASLGVKGSVDITDGGDLTVGANILFVDVSQNSVGIGGQAPDPQFALDVNGPIRGTEIVGKHALQLKGTIFLAHYDGGYPYHTNFTGDVNSVVGGMVPNEIGYYTIRPGKFYKGIVLGTAATNLLVNPSFEVNVTTGWAIANFGGGDLAAARVALDSWVGDYCARLTSTVLGGSYFSSGVFATGDGTTTYTASVYMRAEVPTAVVLQLAKSTSAYDVYATTTVTVTTEWSRFYVAGVPASGVATRLDIRPQTADVDIYVDAAQVEVGASCTAYVDGSLGNGYAWTGTANASSSARSGAHYLAYNNIEIGRAFTLMAWVRPECVPGATSATQTAYAFKIDANNNLAVGLKTNGKWQLARTVNGVNSYPELATAAWQTWQHHATVYDGAGNLAHYVDGVAVYSGSVSPLFEFGAIWQLDLANSGYATAFGNVTLDDVVILERALTAAEVRAVHASDAPVFAESSQKVFRATQRGLVWADEEGLWMRDYLGSAVFGVYGGEAASKSWGGLSLEVGDLLIGRSSGGYVHWDDSTEVLNVKGSITITGGSGYANISDKPTLGTLAAKNSVDLATGEVTNKNLDNVSDGTTYKRVTANEKTGAARGYTALDSGNALVTKVVPGSNVGTPAGAGLYLGADKMGYYNGGWKTYMDNTGKFMFAGSPGSIAWDLTDLYGTDGTTVQWKATASTGKFSAGGGNVTLDADGLTLAVPGTLTESANLKWVSSGTKRAKVTYWDDSAVTTTYMSMENTHAGRNNTLSVMADAAAGYGAYASLVADGDNGADYAAVIVNGGYTPVVGGAEIALLADRTFIQNEIRAWSSAGLSLKDDGGNEALKVNDGGTVTASSLTVGGKLSLGTIEALTISGGAITPTKSFVRLTAESGGVDDLDNINGAASGDLMILRVHSGQTITVRDAVGNIQLNGSFTMSNIYQTLTLFAISTTQWVEISRSAN